MRQVTNDYSLEIVPKVSVFDVDALDEETLPYDLRYFGLQRTTDVAGILILFFPVAQAGARTQARMVGAS